MSVQEQEEHSPEVQFLGEQMKTILENEVFLFIDSVRFFMFSEV
jgi:hypothetical protein